MTSICFSAAFSTSRQCWIRKLPRSYLTNVSSRPSSPPSIRVRIFSSSSTAVSKVFGGVCCLAMTAADHTSFTLSPRDGLSGRLTLLQILVVRRILLLQVFDRRLHLCRLGNALLRPGLGRDRHGVILRHDPVAPD